MFNDMVRWPYLAALAAVSSIMVGGKENEPTAATTAVHRDEIQLSAYISAQSKDECAARAEDAVKRQTSAGLWGRFNSIFIACAHGKPEDEKRQTTYMKCDVEQLSGEAECTPVEPR